MLQLEDLLLHRIARDETRREHPARLANSMRAVDRLRFDRRIPPRIQQEHVVCRRQVETEAARLEADEEDAALGIRLETPNAVLPLKYQSFASRAVARA